VEVEDRLPGALARVDDDAVVVEALLPRRVGDELQHPFCLFGRELFDLAEARHVPLWQDEQVGGRLRRDVEDRDEAVGARDVVALADEMAEETVVRQRGSPPP
jgi:hypothetical protein